jgi:hypothetical protein
VNARTRASLGFTLLGFAIKEHSPTPADTAWVERIVAEHSGTVLTQEQVLVSRCIRDALARRDTTVNLAPLDTARALQPALANSVVFSQGYWVLLEKGIVRMCDGGASKREEAEWFHRLYVNLLEPAMHDATADTKREAAQLEKKLAELPKEATEERERIQEALKRTKGAIAKLGKLRDRCLSLHQARVQGEGPAGNGGHTAAARFQGRAGAAALGAQHWQAAVYKRRA